MCNRIAYSISNVSVKNYQNQLTNVEAIGSNISVIFGITQCIILDLNPEAKASGSVRQCGLN